MGRQVSTIQGMKEYYEEMASYREKVVCEFVELVKKELGDKWDPVGRSYFINQGDKLSRQYHEMTGEWPGLDIVATSVAEDFKKLLEKIEAASAALAEEDRLRYAKDVEKAVVRGWGIDQKEPIRAKPVAPTPTSQLCKKCNDLNEFAEPNQPDGSYLCFGCRT